jgi:hypothetical protein
MEFREKPRTDKYKGITNDSDYVANCTPTSLLRHLRFGTEYFDRSIFVAQSVHFAVKLQWAVITATFLREKLVS